MVYQVRFAYQGGPSSHSIPAIIKRHYKIVDSSWTIGSDWMMDLDHYMFNMRPARSKSCFFFNSYATKSFTNINTASCRKMSAKEQWIMRPLGVKTKTFGMPPFLPNKALTRFGVGLVGKKGGLEWHHVSFSGDFQGPAVTHCALRLVRTRSQALWKRLQEMNCCILLIRSWWNTFGVLLIDICLTV